MYLGVQNTTQTEDFISMQIVDVREPENPTRLGKYELNTSEHILKMEVKEKIAYLPRVKSYLGVGNWLGCCRY